MSERSAALAAEVSLVWPDLLQGRPLVIYRAVLRRVQPAPALRCPQGAIFNIGTRAAAKDRGQHEGAADLPQIICHHALSFWINRRVIELFCAQVFGIRKGRPFDPQRRLSTIRVINLAGGVLRRTHHAAHRRTAHSDFSRQLLLRRIRVRRHLPRDFRPISAGRRRRPMVLRSAFNAIALRSATRHTVA